MIFIKYIKKGYMQIKNLKRIILLVLTIVTPLIPYSSFACKEAILGKTFPITNFDEYDYIVVVKIDQAVHSDKYEYNPLISFKATVLESIKGGLNKGYTFAGIAKKEEAHAVCPVHLDVGGTYLLLLSKENGKYQLSRFSLPIKSDHQYFDNYISQIKAIIGKK